ncbi:hypothetical protein BC828DRAFT_406250 [Blastocladiella britannica]|nr:hypothetical protein BC828DRAFT_406250 [Blastocladiella britannica]
MQDPNSKQSSKSTTTTTTTTTTSSTTTSSSTTSSTTSSSTSSTTLSSTTTSFSSSTTTPLSSSTSTSSSTLTGSSIVLTGTNTSTSTADSKNGGESFWSPTVIGVAGAVVGALALLAALICFVRARNTNRRNDRVYRPGVSAGAGGGGNGGGGTAYEPARNATFQPGLGPPARSPFGGPSSKAMGPPASGGYAGNVVTLVELNDGPGAVPAPPPNPYAPAYVPAGMMPPSPPHMPIAYAPGPQSSMAYATPVPAAAEYAMQEHQVDYGYATGPMTMGSGGSGGGAYPTAGTAMQDYDDGLMFAPTIQRDTNGYGVDMGGDDMPVPGAPPGMEYRANPHTGQQELYYQQQQQQQQPMYGGYDQQQEYGGYEQQQQQQQQAPQHGGSPSHGPSGAPSGSRRIALPGNH